MHNIDKLFFTYQGPDPGRSLLVLGALHGEEICGSVALAQLRTELDVGVISLKAGRLVLVPICNPLAYQSQKHFMVTNLNRAIKRYSQARHYEEAYADLVAKLIEETDVVLDLHSFAEGDAPSLFLDHPTPANEALATAQRVPFWITGWPELYGRHLKHGSTNDTLSYAHLCGKSAVLIECGRDDDPASVSIAYQCIRRTLDHLGMLPDNRGNAEAPKPQRFVMEIALLREEESVFARKWNHLDPVNEGDAIIIYRGERCFRAPFMGVVILPNAKADVGQEWLYVGRFV